jgi:hypothetical protein
LREKSSRVDSPFGAASLIGMAPRVLIAIGAVFAAGALHADTPASSELHLLLLTDALFLPLDTPSLAPTTPATKKEVSPLTLPSQIPSDLFAPHLNEDRVTEFFRTGVLLSDHKDKDHPIKKLSVGPCEGGQLLNLRTNW